MPTASLEGKSDLSPKIHDCKRCGLFANCNTPKIPYSGQGKRRILIIGPSVNHVEDSSGNTRRGSSYNYLAKNLKQVGIDLEEDCWYTHATRCYTKNNLGITTQSACHRMLMKEIEELDPIVIVPAAPEAFDILLYERVVGRASTASYFDWCGELIPDQVLLRWVAPIYSASFVDDKNDKRQNPYILFWHKHMENMLIPLSRPKAIDTYTHVCKTEKDAISALTEAQGWSSFAFDYETTGIKPYDDGHKIAYISISDGEIAYSFPNFHSSEFQGALKKLLTNDAVKIAHNANFERSWTREILGYEVVNLTQDTMILQHCLNNRKPTGLKFLTYARYGYLGYDADADEYLRASTEDERAHGTNAFNRVFDAPVNKMLQYNALDSIFTAWLFKDLYQELDRKHQLPGYKFFMELSLAFYNMHREGFLLDMDLMARTAEEIEKAIRPHIDLIMEDPLIVQQWNGAHKFNPRSDYDIRTLLFKILKLEPKEFTDKGQPSVDAESLILYRDAVPILAPLFQVKRLSKLGGTYIRQMRAENNNGVMRSYYNLNRVVTYRSSCVAKGTKILVNRAYDTNPEGIPIEEVVEGDYVLCLDVENNPHWDRVTFSGKTGTKQVIRIHYSKRHGKKGYVDLTPEHKVRLSSGEFVRADQLMRDYRDPTRADKRYLPKCSVASIHRDVSSSKRERLFVTGHIESFLEHVLVANDILGVDTKGKAVHHIDENHTNHYHGNLSVMEIEDHSRLHNSTEERIAMIVAQVPKAIAARKQMAVSGELPYLTGEDNPLYLALTKEECLREMCYSRGRPSKTRYTYVVFKRECERNGIDLLSLCKRFNSKGEYIWRSMLFNAIKRIGMGNTLYKAIGMNYYSIHSLMNQYGITASRGITNQTGVIAERVVTWNNHTVTSIEEIEECVDVYDISTEKYHNFIANEICVHNCSAINLQNQPKRDKESRRIIRSLYIPKRGHRLVEYDFKAMEVSVAAAVTGDRNLIAYVTDSSKDMHRDLAKSLFMVDEVGKNLRGNATKGPWTFAQFYGSYWKQCAEGVWAEIDIPNAVDVYGFDVVKHLKKCGIKTYEKWEKHCEEQEYILWNEFFPGYKQWREETYELFCEQGYIDYVNGFRYYGPASRNEVLNGPVQGPAFAIQAWSFKEMDKYLRENKFNSQLICQVHDSELVDMDPAEEGLVDKMMHKFATEEVRKHWDWITVPLVMEKDRGEIDGSWADMESMGVLNG